MSGRHPMVVPLEQKRAGPAGSALFYVGLSLLLCAGSGLAKPAPPAPASPLPADVARFLDRRADCDHWTGEEPYDAERRRQIEAAIASLGCTRIERDAGLLRRRHAHRPDIVEKLSD